MKKIVAALALASASFVAMVAQEQKPVPKDSVRVMVPGCAKGYVFTAARAAEDQPGGSVVPEGMHLRMNGPKKMMSEIKSTEGSRIEITGLMKKGQVGEEGIAIGRGIRVRPGGGGPSAGLGGSIGVGSPAGGQVMIDVEGWRQLLGDCPR